MKKKLIKTLAITCLVLSCCIVNNFSIPAHAETSSSTSCDLSEVETIAKNAPQFILGSDKIQWSDVDVVNSKPLYDFNDKLVAYSLDLKSNINNEDAFVIISTSQEDEPILEFGVKQQSPYDKVTDNQNCIFDGFQGYYSHGKGTSKYHDISNNKDLENEEIKFCIDNSKNKKYVSAQPDIAKKSRLNLIGKVTKDSKVKTTTSSAAVFTSSALSTSKNSVSTSSTPVTVVTSKTISGVPDYPWTLGCVPTSSAMVLKYTYSSKLSNVSSSTLIKELANAMGTSSTGSTYNDNIASGIKTVMRNHGVTVACSTATSSNSTFSKAVTEIKNGYPFLASLIGSTETARSYPATNKTHGFGNHTMACVGYNITTTTNDSGTTTNHYIVVHDTGCDGNVYCDYDSSAFGTPYWTTIH